MKIKIPTTKEIEIQVILIEVPVNYGEEDIPNNFPMRFGNKWRATVEIDTGKILDWPPEETGEFKMHMKVCDSGVYSLFDTEGKCVADRSDYVPHGVVPGEYGDYIELNIKDGAITNWPKNPDVSAIVNGYFNIEE